MKKEMIIRRIIREELIKVLSENIDNTLNEEEVIFNEAGIPCTYKTVIDGLVSMFKNNKNWKDDALTYLDEFYKLQEDQVEKIIDEVSKLIAFEKNK